ncbi:MAG TPA: flavodoxin family protein [Planctomycetaceae bacterium]|nr:flavodoxin family protein [Planctomycetaceae bacterium]HIQ21900.1 flavodoxin family protein [Planctomycetota bacterium]
MKVLLVIGHQNRSKTSFCHAIARTAVEGLRGGGHEVSYHDLYEEEFDPILPHEEIPKGAKRPPAIEAHCREVTAADGFVVVHPNWWGQPPAVLKGWVDRVFCEGVAFEFGEGGEVVELLRGKRAVVFTTSNTPREIELERFGDPLENLWKNCIFRFCGVTDFYRRNFESIVMSTPQQRREWLDEVRRVIAQHFPPGA